jgi:hypothetical protein
MISKCRQNNNRIFGASDASFRLDKATPAWVISSGDVSDLEIPNMTITGSGAVDGYPVHISSGRGELHMALSIISQL